MLNPPPRQASFARKGSLLRRFEPVAMAIVSMLVAIILYLLSLNVAHVRREIELIDGKLARTRQDLRMLQVEFNARATPAQIEQWNQQMLGLSPPAAHQYSSGGSGGLAAQRR